jgi:hypothetical protein
MKLPKRVPIIWDTLHNKAHKLKKLKKKKKKKKKEKLHSFADVLKQ